MMQSRHDSAPGADAGRSGAYPPAGTPHPPMRALRQSLDRLIIGVMMGATVGLAGIPGLSHAAQAGDDARDLARAWRMYSNPRLERMWGIQIVGIRLVSSAWMLEFKYRVVDPDKAKLLLDQRNKAYLTDKASGAVLAVPSMENIGELRQVSAMRNGQNYFMIFGNANKVVAQGSRVNIQIGAFEATDLIVE